MGRFRVDCDFPGGNIIVDRTDKNDVFVYPDIRDNISDWFYWYYRVRGAAGRILNFHFTTGNYIGVRGPAVSKDHGRAWSWLGTKTVNEASFQYAFGSNDKEMRFSFGMPYQEKNLYEFIAGHTKHPNLNIRTLCQTRKARKTERLHLGRVDGKAKHRVLITCRHHCCEMMASYSLEGIMEAILADTDEGRWFGENVEFLIIPFMDKDGVEDGDQGKNRAPHDHGRDYVGNSIYSSVKTLREFVPKWSEGKLGIALDLHCPHIRGLCNEKIYLVGLESQDIWQEQCVFSEILESVQTGPLVFRAKDNLPYGQEWNKGENWANGKSFPQWAVNLPGIKLASAIEIPYANAGGKEVTAETAKRFGYDFARAVRTYIETT